MNITPITDITANIAHETIAISNVDKLSELEFVTDSDAVMLEVSADTVMENNAMTIAKQRINISFFIN